MGDGSERTLRDRPLADSLPAGKRTGYTSTSKLMTWVMRTRETPISLISIIEPLRAVLLSLSAMQEALARFPLFRALSVTALKKLGGNSEWRRFRKGEVLFEEGRPAESVWLIQRGWVYLVKRTPQGTPVTIFTVTPEEVLCGFSAVVGQSIYYASAIAATETTAIRVPHTDFARLLSDQSGFAEQVLAIYHTRMRHMADAISLAQAPVEQRLAYVLLRLRATFGKTIPITHHELSHMAGTRWETSIRTLSAMKRRGWIASSRAKITVLAPAKLQGLLDHQAPT